VIAQTRSDWELIVIDDGSSDGTAERVEEYRERDDRIRLLRQENSGLSASRNAGGEIARGELISFLDADDMWLPTYLERMGAALDAAPDAGFAFTDAWSMDADTQRFRRRTAMARSHPPEVVPEDPVEIMELLVRENFIWVSATVRRRALDEAGWFRADFRLTEDIEMWFRMLALGYRGIRVPGGPLGVKREREQALSRQLVDNMVSRQRVLRLVIENDQIPASVKEPAATRIEELERDRRLFSGESRGLAVAMSARRVLGAVKRATLGRAQWRRRPPPEVREAFPDLQPR
jgi:hypothetical protein